MDGTANWVAALKYIVCLRGVEPQYAEALRLCNKRRSAHAARSGRGGVVGQLKVYRTQNG
jgi:hypothetical protein